eukprot:scaffold496_cov380-Prasinococcus_capsulatus_cf.AAC.3
MEEPPPSRDSDVKLAAWCARPLTPLRSDPSDSQVLTNQSGMGPGRLPRSCGHCPGRTWHLRRGGAPARGPLLARSLGTPASCSPASQCARARAAAGTVRQLHMALACSPGAWP